MEKIVGRAVLALIFLSLFLMSWPLFYTSLVFAQTPPFNFIAPAAGTNLVAGSTVTIQWSGGGFLV